MHAQMKMWCGKGIIALHNAACMVHSWLASVDLYRQECKLPLETHALYSIHIRSCS